MSVPQWERIVLTIIVAAVVAFIAWLYITTPTGADSSEIDEIYPVDVVGLALVAGPCRLCRRFIGRHVRRRGRLTGALPRR
jgi:hypothetical protein